LTNQKSQELPTGAASSVKLMTYLPCASVYWLQTIGGPMVTQTPLTGAPVLAFVTVPQTARPVVGQGGFAATGGAVGDGDGVGDAVGVGVGVGDGLTVGVGVFVAATVGAGVFVAAAVGAAVVAAGVGVAVGAAVVAAGVGLAVGVGDGLGVAVGDGFTASVAAAVGDGDAVVCWVGAKQAVSTTRTATVTAVVLATRRYMLVPFPSWRCGEHTVLARPPACTFRTYPLSAACGSKLPRRHS